VTVWRPSSAPAPREGPVHSAHAPAKVNLTLGVAGRSRPDGYHRVRGVSARLTLVDDLDVRTTGIVPTTSGDMLRMRPGSAGVLSGDDLALKAAEALRRWAARPLPRLALAMRKRIPVGAGLGGGSSDAAAALRLAVDVWRLEIGEEELVALAMDLGSDVPFFLSPSPVGLVTGRGEAVEPLPATGIAGTGVLLVSREGKSSTAAIFAGLHSQRARPAGAADAATERLVALLQGDANPAALVALAPDLRDANELYPAAARLIPGLAELRERIEGILARPTLFSGAGPTLFVLYPSPAEAREALRVLRSGLGKATDAGRAPKLIATAIASR
jgi:4-diphosphocytidyl-2-C-methyl-D-erythritol kinase